MPWIIFECFFMILHIPPFLELMPLTKYFNLIYTVLISIMAFKTLILFRSLELFSPLNNQTSRLIMFFSKVEFTDRSILVKAWINMNPGKFLFFSFVYYMMTASYILKISERTNIYNKAKSLNPVDRCYENVEQDYNNPSVSNEPVTYFNAFWMLSITFLTVGYGDYFPMTFPGRIIAVLTTVLGQLYAAIVVGIVSQQLLLTTSDVTALNILENRKRQDVQKEQASNIIKDLFKLNVHRKYCLRNDIPNWQETSRARKLYFNMFVKISHFRNLTRELMNKLE